MKLKKPAALLSSMMLFCSAIPTMNSLAVESELTFDEFWDKCSGDYGYNSFLVDDHEKGEAKQKFYNDLNDAVKSFWNDYSDIEAEKDYYGVDCWVVSRVPFSHYNLTQKDAIEVYYMFQHDHPLAYYASNLMSVSGVYDSSIEEWVYCVDIQTVSDFAEGSVRKKLNKDITDYIGELNKADSYSSLYEKARYLYEELTRDTVYAYDDMESESSHCIIGAIENGKGVCESYSKTLELLFNYYGIESLIVTGNTGGPHMWNMAKMDDGVYYGFDATYDDNSDNKETPCRYSYFAGGEDAFSDHTPDTTKGEYENYLYSLPKTNKNKFKKSFSGYSLTLNEGISTNIFISKAAKEESLSADSKAFVRFTLSDGRKEEVPLSEGIETENGFKYSVDLGAEQMSDKVKTELFADGKLIDSTTSSVKNISQAYLNSEDTKEKELADAMLNYGAYAQIFNGNDKNLSADVKKYDTNYTIPDKFKYTLDQKAAFTVKSATLSLGSKVGIIVNYNIPTNFDSSKAVNFHCDKASKLELKQNGNVVGVSMKEISPADFDTVYTFTATYEGKETVFTYSPYTYMKYVLDNADTMDKNLVNLVNSMYDYCLAAKNYKS